MKPIKALSALVVAIGLVVGTGWAFAHCDSEDGPVAKAVYQALDSGNINLVLPFAPATAETELKATFAEAREARTLGPAARKVADRLFLETAIRLHRAGEGATFTGVKAAGIDYGPMIPAAEKAIETGDLQQIKAVLSQEVDHVLAEKLAKVRELRARVSSEPKTYDQVAAARTLISAELGFITYAEGIRQAVRGNIVAPHEE